MTWLAGLVVWLFSASSTVAACPPELLGRLLDQGFSREDVLQVCGGGQGGQAQPAPAEPADQDGLPAWLAGDWNVTETLEGSSEPGRSSPPITVPWRIEVGAGGTLAITEMPGEQLTGMGLGRAWPYEVHEVRVSGSRLSFIARLHSTFGIRTTAYELDLSGEEGSVTGRWSRNTHNDVLRLPAESWGTVRMSKD